ncbi:glycosyltransferase [Streptomyces sp. ZYX-F-203]
MSVHSHPAARHPGAATAAFDPSHAPEFPRHVVTAVLVSHDGDRWLPEALAGLLGQERPVQQVTAADTGSSDDCARLLAEALGDDRVVHLARRAGFGQAVAEAARTAPALTPDDLPYLRRPDAWDPVTRTWRDDVHELPELPHGEPVQWLWLLHDDCAPDPAALAELLRVVESESELGRDDVAVVGPKLRGWYDERQLLEVGVTIAASGRRWTGLDRREQDQGQHDHVRPVLAVSTAGMLVRRDVFERLGGFDRHLPLMRDDVDLCWRAQAAGYRVLVAPEAVVRHAEAASRERRAIDCVGRAVASPRRVDKAGAVRTLLVDTATVALPWVVLRLVLGTLLRAGVALLGKAPGQALDELRGLLSVVLRPGRVLAGRRDRGRPQVTRRELRPLFPPPGATLRAALEQTAGRFGRRSSGEATPGAGRHGATTLGADDAVPPEARRFARLRRVARAPGPLLLLVLVLSTLAASRALFGEGGLSGGALLPAPDSPGELWARFSAAWHPVGTGDASAAPPYLALLALAAVLSFGSPDLAVTLSLLGSVPLAGMSAYLASRPLVTSRLLRAWAAVAYAFLPAVTGAVAGGRIGTAVLAVLLPWAARTGVAAAGLSRADGARGSWRAAWGHALLLTVATAFTPIVWPVALVLGVVVLVSRGRDLTAYGPRVLAQLATPLILLAPWSFSLFPFGFLREAGLADDSPTASAHDLLGADPSGPGTLSGPLLFGVVAAALAALLRSDRRSAIGTAWIAALTGLLLAVLANGSAWAGPATLVYGVGLLAAAVLGADGARARVAERSFGWRQPLAALVAFAAAAGPLLAAAGWMVRGAGDPLERRAPEQVPAFVAEESRTRDQARTLVLDSDSATAVRYVLVRGSGARLGDAETAAAAGSNTRLDRVVASLVAGSGADQAARLGDFAVRYVLVHDGAPREIARVLDSTVGLTRLSRQDGVALWRVEGEIARATITEGSGTALPVAAGPVEIHTDIPAGAEGRVLRLADTADSGWTATLDGKPLTGTTVDGWAQGFALPESGGRIDVTHEAPLAHTAWLWCQGLLAAVLVVLVLPGRRRDVDDDLPDEPSTPSAAAGEGRRARRLRAQAAGAAGESGAHPPGTWADAPREPAGDAVDGTGGPLADHDRSEVSAPFQADPLGIPAQGGPGVAYAVDHPGVGPAGNEPSAAYESSYGAHHERGVAPDPSSPPPYRQEPPASYDAGHGVAPGGGYEASYRGAYDPTLGGGYDPGHEGAYDATPGGGYDAGGAPYGTDHLAPYGGDAHDPTAGYDPIRGPAVDPRHPHGTTDERPDGSRL